MVRHGNGFLLGFGLAHIMRQYDIAEQHFAIIAVCSEPLLNPAHPFGLRGRKAAFMDGDEEQIDAAARATADMVERYLFR